MLAHEQEEIYRSVVVQRGSDHTLLIVSIQGLALTLELMLYCLCSVRLIVATITIFTP